MLVIIGGSEGSQGVLCPSWPFSLVMCDISKKDRFRDNFVDIVIISIFDTALADFEKVIFCDNYGNIEEYFDKSTSFSV